MTGIAGDRGTGCCAALQLIATGWTGIFSVRTKSWTSVPVRPGSEGTLPALLGDVSADMRWTGMTTIWSVSQGFLLVRQFTLFSQFYFASASWLVSWWFVTEDEISTKILNQYSLFTIIFAIYDKTFVVLIYLFILNKTKKLIRKFVEEFISFFYDLMTLFFHHPPGFLSHFLHLT